MFNKKEFKILLIKKGKTIQELADFLGINRATLYRKIHGKSDFYRDEIQKCKVFFEESNLDHIFFSVEVS